MEERPDPDSLLKLAEAEETASRRGRLKLFFGANAGVGKTYAMLEAARQRKKENVDVVVGVVETHGRSETAALLEGLEVLPKKDVAYKGFTLKEFDIDAALARKPQLILVDELAHTNAPGSRHPKRWQDIEELLDAGISVYTTLNVQHWESLNDKVAQVTGVVVRETVPDSFLERTHLSIYAADFRRLRPSPRGFSDLQQRFGICPVQRIQFVPRQCRRPSRI